MQEYETIKRGRAMLEASRTGGLSERTITGYKAKARRIMRLAGAGAGIEELIACAKQTRSASTWFSRRAALMHSLRQLIEHLLAEQDKMQRALKDAQVPTVSPEWDAWRRTVRNIGRTIVWCERLQQEPGPALEDRKPRRSKRKDLRGLPEDWRERLVQRLPKYRAAALAAAVTGCRPDELVTGIKLSIVGGQLVAEIAGAKVTEKSGQPWRRLSWPADSASPLVAMLVEEVRNGLELARIANAKTFSGAVRAAGAREWPRRKSTVTPYCFRHAMASDMKTGGMDDGEISQALGHCSDVARSYYGQWQMGRSAGGVAPRAVQAARPVHARKELSVFGGRRTMHDRPRFR